MLSVHWPSQAKPEQAYWPAHAVGMFEVVPLRLLVDVVEHNHAGDEVHHLPRRQQIEVLPAVPPSVSIA